MKSPNTNSPVVAGIVLVLLALSAWWQGWPGAAIYVVGFLAGGFGTVINQARTKKLQAKLREMRGF